MLLDLEQLVGKYRMNVSGVVHAGAHLAEEADLYQRLFGTAPVWWIEANPKVIPKIQQAIRRYPNQQVIEACLWSEGGVRKTFNVTNHDGMSSSLLEFGTHTEFSTDTWFEDHIDVVTATLDELAADHGIKGCNLLNMDLQGVELAVANGAKTLIRDEIDYINSEVNTDEVYVGCAKLNELDRYFGTFGFRRVAQSIVPGQGWGDALWVRR